MTAVRSILLAVAVVLPLPFAFAGGGAGDGARAAFLWATCTLALLAAIVAPAPLPRGRPLRVALAAFALLALLTIAARAWTPDPGGWLQQTELVLAYTALLYAVAALVPAGAGHARTITAGVCAGLVLVTAYALAGHAAGDLIEGAQPVRAGGRLSLPLGYWNAQGALAAVALAGCCGLIADRARRPAARAAALAAVVPLTVAVELSYSRAAIVAAAAGLLVVVARSRSGAPLRVTLGAPLLAAAAAVLVMLPFPAFRAGPVPIGRGGPVLLLIAGVAAVAFVALRRSLIARTGDGEAPAAPIRRIAAGGAAVLAATLIVAPLFAPGDAGTRGYGASGERLSQLGSNRGRYWHVALDQFVREPLHGAGTGAFRDVWLRERPIDETVTNAHSLWLETAAELGLPGLVLLLTGTGAIAVAARRHESDAAVAMLASFALLLAVDWHWQIPALTAPMFVIAGSVLVPARRGRTVTDAASASAG